MTGLRGVAAVMVAIYHINPETIAPSGVGRIVGKGYLWVDLFFILSGFVLALNYAQAFARGWSARAWIDFLMRRVARIYPLYGVLVLGGLACMLAGVGQSPAAGLLPMPAFHHPMLESVANVLMIQAWGIGPSIDGTAWSLSTEWAAYLLFPLLVTLTLFSRPSTAVGVGLIVAGLAAGTVAMTGYDGAYHSGPLDAYDGGTIEPILRCLSGFVLGLLTFRAAGTPRVVAWAGHDVVLGVVIALLLFCLGAGAHDLLTYPLFAALVLGLYGNRRRVGRVLGWRPLYWLGAVSYSIYLLHPLLVLPRRALDGALQSWVPPSCAYWMTSVAAYALLVLVGDMSYRFIEKPGRRLLIRLVDNG